MNNASQLNNHESFVDQDTNENLIQVRSTESSIVEIDSFNVTAEYTDFCSVFVAFFS
jgi:hypothetical protein